MDLIICDYGCRKKGKFKLKNGKWCCNKSQNSCPEMKKKNIRGQLDKKRPNLCGTNNPMFGKKRLDLSERNLINNPMNNIEARKKNSEWHKNRKHSEETKKKQSIYHKGKIKSEKHRKNLSYAMKGDKNPQWRGGISCEPYCPLWNDKEYKDSLRIERDNNKCNNPLCEGKSNRLCLHHINYNKKDCRPVNLITVCISCNFKANKDREWHKAFYNELIRRKYVKCQN